MTVDRGDESFEGETVGGRKAGSCGVNPGELTEDGTEEAGRELSKGTETLALQLAEATCSQHLHRQGGRVPTGEKEPQIASTSHCAIARGAS